MLIPFQDRSEAGRGLADQLKKYSCHPHAVIVALARGGVPVALEVAERTGIPMEVLAVGKLRLPGGEEIAMGAVAESRVRMLDPDLLRLCGISTIRFQALAETESALLQNRTQQYHEHLPRISMNRRLVILVDDGMHTGSSMLAAVEHVREQGSSRILVAVPVASASAYETVRQATDEIVCLAVPEPFGSVARWYVDYPKLSDLEVRRVLDGVTVNRFKTALSIYSGFRDEELSAGSEARANRETFKKLGITVVSLMSPARAGKTAILEQTLPYLRDRYRLAVIEADLYTASDAERIRRIGIPVWQLDRKPGFHLNASSISGAIKQFPIGGTELFVIEAVTGANGTVIPDLGEDIRVIVHSAREAGPVPQDMQRADAVLLNKLDLSPSRRSPICELRSEIERAMPLANIFEVSGYTGKGIPEWTQWLTSQISRLGRKVNRELRAVSAA